MPRHGQAVLATALFAAIAFSGMFPQLTSAQFGVRDVTFDAVIVRVNARSMAVQRGRSRDAVELINLGITINGEPLGPADIQIAGKRTAKFLAAGMFVRFDADFQGRRKIVGKVSEIWVLGKIPPPVFGLTPVADEDEADVAADDEAPAAKGAATTRYLVVGGIKRIMSDGAILVEMPDPFRGGRLNKTYRAELTKDAAVRIADITFARMGDRVHISGLEQDDGNRRAAGPAPGPRLVYATKVTVTPAAAGVAAGERGPIPGEVNRFADGEEPPKAGKNEPAKPKFKGRVIKIN